MALLPVHQLKSNLGEHLEVVLELSLSRLGFVLDLSWSCLGVILELSWSHPVNGRYRRKLSSKYGKICGKSF